MYKEILKIILSKGSQFLWAGIDIRDHVFSTEIQFSLMSNWSMLHDF